MNKKDETARQTVITEAKAKSQKEPKRRKSARTPPLPWPLPGSSAALALRRVLGLRGSAGALRDRATGEATGGAAVGGAP